MSERNPLIGALDLATRSGYSFGYCNDRAPVSGSLRFGKPETDMARRLRNYRNWLAGFVHKLREIAGPDGEVIFIYEAPIAGTLTMGRTNMQTTRVLIGLSSITEEYFVDRPETLVEASVNDVRKHFIGSNPRGDIGKRLTVEKNERLGWEVEDHNAADANALWSYMRSIVNPKHAIVPTGGLFAGQTIIKPKPRREEVEL